MKPVQFKESTKVLTAPDGMPNCATLDVWCDGKQYISKWKPSFRDRVKILFGASLWLGVMSGKTQPPVFVTADYPFKPKSR